MAGFDKDTGQRVWKETQGKRNDHDRRRKGDIDQERDQHDFVLGDLLEEHLFSDRSRMLVDGRSKTPVGEKLQRSVLVKDKRTKGLIPHTEQGVRLNSIVWTFFRDNRLRSERWTGL